MGLDAASIGNSSIERAVTQRMASRQMKELADYAALLAASAAEVQELIETVVVPETWFFRDNEAFVTLGRLAQEEWARVHPEGKLRVLSAPCSTGEEPYSIAMSLLAAGFPAARFQVDGIDISERALEKAQQAVFRKNSFRGADVHLYERYFEPMADGQRIVESVRSLVHFRPGNLMDGQFAAPGQMYDFIFCRNVLIYFDRPTQDQVLHLLRRLLTPKGVIFVGPSETGLLLSHDFVSAKVPLAFAFYKPSVTAVPPVEPALPVRAVKREMPKPAPLPKPPVKPVPVPPAKLKAQNPLPAPVAPPAAVEPDLQVAARLADEGRLSEAAQICELYLRQRGDSARAYFILGLVRDAAGETDQAVGFYRKSLYLEPNDYETLVHLSLLARKTGDEANAQVLENRARRAKEKLKPVTAKTAGAGKL